MNRKVLVAIVTLLAAACQNAITPPPAKPTPRQVPEVKPDIPVPAPHYGIEIIDSHVHIVPTMAALGQALEVLEGVGIHRFVAKSAGAYGTTRFWSTVAMKRVLGERFEFFCNIDWDAIDDPKFAERTAKDLELAALAGAKGVKIFKALGLRVKTADGRLLPVDDPRLDPIFEKAGEAGLIVAMHTADPVAFFEPITPDNERYEELSIAPRWSFFGDEFPSHDQNN